MTAATPRNARVGSDGKGREITVSAPRRQDGAPQEKIRTENLHAWFGSTEALRGITLTIP